MYNPNIHTISCLPLLTSSPQCIERGNEQCILTQALEPLEIVPIYAGSLGHQKALQTTKPPGPGCAYAGVAKQQSGKN
jgi:hypothetical protein